MTKILVTGAGGLLGSYLVPLLEEQGSEVIPASRDTVDLARPLDPTKLPERIDALIYLAQSSRFREFPEAAEDIFQVNTAQVVAMLDYARRVGASNFVYASTGSVYAPSGSTLNEASPLAQPMGYYPASKRAAEVLAAAFAPHLHVAILRYFFIYGAGQKCGMLIPRMVDCVREGRSVTLQGNDGLRINPVHASDAARATAAASRLDHTATINIAGPDALSLREMTETIGAKVGRAPLFQTHSDEKPGHLVADTALMSMLLVPPTCRFADGVEDLL